MKKILSIVLTLALMVSVASGVSAQGNWKEISAKQLLKGKEVKFANTQKSFDQIEKENGFTSKIINASDIPSGATVINVEYESELEALLDDMSSNVTTSFEVKMPVSKTKASTSTSGISLTATTYEKCSIQNFKRVIYDGSLARVNLHSSANLCGKYSDSALTKYIAGTSYIKKVTPSTSYTGFTLATSYKDNTGMPVSSPTSSDLKQWQTSTVGVLEAYLVIQAVFTYMSKNISGTSYVYVTA